MDEKERQVMLESGCDTKEFLQFMSVCRVGERDRGGMIREKGGERRKTKDNTHETKERRE